jgi:ankyrin repeat protein
VEVVQQLLQAGWDANARTTDGTTPLLLAAQRGHVAVASLLLKHGVPINAAEGAAPCPLHKAVQNGHADMVKVLLEAGASVSTADVHGYMPLHAACSEGYDKVTEQLLAAGAAPDAVTSAGDTPLHITCRKGSMAVARLLLGAGAAVNPRDQQGKTPLHVACVHGHALLVDLLVTHGAQTDAKDKDGSTPLQCAASCHTQAVLCRLLAVKEVAASVDTATPDGRTPLFLACYEGDGEAVRLLLAAGADVRLATHKGYTAVYAATYAAKCNKGLSALQQVLAAGADPGAASKDGRTALHCAAAAGQLPALQALLAELAAGKGCSGSAAVNAMIQGISALHMAVANGNSACVEALLAAGADPDQVLEEGAVDHHGNSLEGINPLYRAVQLGHCSMVPLLATAANLRQVWHGHTALHLAVYAEDAAMAAPLVAARAPAGVADEDGATPMALAAASSNAGVWALLPAMVRSECNRIQQLEADRDARRQHHHHQQQQPQNQHQKEEEEKEEAEEDPAGELEHVVDVVCSLLESLADAGAEGRTDSLTGCLAVFSEVLGPAAASSLLHKLLELCSRVEDAGEHSGYHLKLLRAVHSGWLGALEPLMHQRHGIIKDMQDLVVRPIHKQLKLKVPQAPAAGAGAAGAWVWRRGKDGREWKYAEYVGVGGYVGPWGVTWAQVMAAGDAGDWQLVVQHLEALRNMSDDGPESSCSLYLVAAQKGWVCRAAAMAGLCGALLEGWEVARQQVPAKMGQELAPAVVAAVEACKEKELWKAAGGGNKRRRRG